MYICIYVSKYACMYVLSRWSVIRASRSRDFVCSANGKESSCRCANPHPKPDPNPHPNPNLTHMSACVHVRYPLS